MSQHLKTSQRSAWLITLLPLILLVISTSPLLAQQVFVNVTGPAGIGGQTGLGHAVAWIDLDLDGDQDLSFSNQDGSGFWLYSNDGDGTFTNITATAGLAGIGAYKILWADLAGDEFPEMVTWASGSTRLYLNGGGGTTFTNITGGSGLSGTLRGVADFDNDGNADLVTWHSDHLWLYPGNGDGTFAPSIDVGYAPDAWTSICFDYDLDGLIDIYIGTYSSSGVNRLFHNDGGSFSETAATAGVAWSGATHGLDVGDYNNDGLPDIYCGSYSSPGCKLYRNDGDGTFTDVTYAAGVQGHTDTRTVSFNDYDNDGWLDIFSSHHDFYSYSNEMYHNLGDGTFTESSTPLGLDGEWIGDYFGVGWGDYDNDGAIDLFSAGHIDKYRLRRNVNCPGNYLIVELQGTISNSSAIGATGKLYACDRELTRWVIAGSGRHDYHSLPLEFGLGSCATIDSLVITWPSGYIQRLVSPAINQHLRVVEPEDLTAVNQVAPAASIDLTCAPNPFNPRTTISFALTVGQELGFMIFTVQGRQVLQMDLGYRGAGTHHLTWRGDDQNGNPLPSGLYLLRLTGDEIEATGRAVLLK